MRTFLMFLTCLLLTSCIDIGVDDFGTYWTKGYIDPSLLGQWDLDDKSGNFVITNQGGTYNFTVRGKHKTEKDRDAGPSRTLQIGDYTFLMVLDEKSANDDSAIKSGVLYRYKVAKNKFYLYPPNGEHIGAFLREKYPAEKNITTFCKDKKPIEGSDGKHTCSYFSVKILKLDDQVHEIISEIPDTPQFWEMNGSVGQQMAIKHLQFKFNE